MAPESNTTQPAPAPGAPRQRVVVPAPEQGANVTVDSSAGGQLEFKFDPGLALGYGRTGNDLNFELEGGSSVTLRGFFAVGNESLPTLIMTDGEPVASLDFLQGKISDLSTAAGPAGANSNSSGPGTYDDDPGDGLIGIDRLGKLPTDFWGRGSQVPDDYEGADAPGGDVSFGSYTPRDPSDPDNPIDIPSRKDVDGNVHLKNAMYEDGRANQHLYGNTNGDGNVNSVRWGEILIDDTGLSGNTYVGSVALSNFPVGTIVEFRNAKGDVVERWEIDSPDNLIYFGRGYVENLDGLGTARGVFVLPPADHDGDMHLTSIVQLVSNVSGNYVVRNPTLDIIVDAVADKPYVEGAGIDVNATVYTDSIKVSEKSATQDYEDGWAKDSVNKGNSESHADDVTLTVKFGVELIFGDFKDGSEKHYALVEVPSQSNIVGTQEAGDWKVVDGSLSKGLSYDGTVVTIYYVNGTAYDDIDDARAHGWTDGGESKQFFRFEVSNEFLKEQFEAGNVNPADPSQVKVEVGFDMEGSNTGITEDTNFNLVAGAQAKEVIAEGELELTWDNNNSYTWTTDGTEGTTVPLHVDTVDSQLTLNAGWVAEGNNAYKNVVDREGGKHDDPVRAPGQPQWDPAAYEKEQDGDKAPQADSYDYRGGGAPLQLSIAGGEAGEHITRVEFSFDSNEAVFRVGDQAIDAASSPYEDLLTGAIYTYSVDGEGVATVTITGLGDKTDNMDGFGMNFVPKNYYEDADIGFSYKVDVEAASGAQAQYSGSSTVVVDAVADISDPVTSKIAETDEDMERIDHVGADAASDKGVILKTNDDSPKDWRSTPGDNVADKHYESGESHHKLGDKDTPAETGVAGWEIDDFKLDYSQVEYGFSVHVDTKFWDLDGSEKHYILVEQPNASWSLNLDSLREGCSWTEGDFYTAADGTVYFKVDVTAIVDKTTGNVGLDIPLKYSGGSPGDDKWTFKTGSYVEEQLGSDSHGHSTGREHDLYNNVAVRTDTDEVTYKVDVINSELRVKTGWASEGANDAKHVAKGEGYKIDPKGPAADYAGATGEADTQFDGCAPIKFNLSGYTAGGDWDKANGDPEYITSIKFTFDPSRGTLIPDGNDKYVLTPPTPDDPNTWILTPKAGVNPYEIEVYFKPTDDPESDAYYDDSDVSLLYQVNVSNATDSTPGSSSSYSFRGSSTVVIDAVADRSGEVKAEGPGVYVNSSGAALATNDDTGDRALTNPENLHDTKGWETDTYKLDYSDQNYSFVLTMSTTFPDTDGSEKHYILVECKENWSLGTPLPPGYNWTKGDFYETDTAKYFKIEVTATDPATGKQIGSVENVPIPLVYSGTVSGDLLEQTFKTGSYVHDDKYDGKGGVEFDEDNNHAWREGTEISYSTDVINSKLKVNTGWGSEGGNDAKHLGATSDKYDVSMSSDGKAIGYKDSTHDGSARIKFDLSEWDEDTDGSAETISRIIFTFDSSRGALVADGSGKYTLEDNKDGTWTLTVTGKDVSAVEVYFQPKDGSYDYSDVDMTYGVTVNNEAGSSYTFTGTSQVVIDAVADKPDASALYSNAEKTTATDADRNVDYPDVRNPGYDPDKPEGPDNPRYVQIANPEYDPTLPAGPDNPEFLPKEQGAAKRGDVVTVHGKVHFDDGSGGENHTLWIQSGTSKQYSTNGFTATGTTSDGKVMTFVYDADAKPAPTLTITVDGQVVMQAAGADLVTKTGSYYELNVNKYAGMYDADYVNAGDVANANTIKDFVLDIDITVTKTTTGDITVGFGGKADVANVPEGPSGGAAGGSASANYEFDKGNNTADDSDSITVKVQMVDSSFNVKVGSAFENAHWNAHQGFYSRGQLLPKEGVFKVEDYQVPKRDADGKLIFDKDGNLDLKVVKDATGLEILKYSSAPITDGFTKKTDESMIKAVLVVDYPTGTGAHDTLPPGTFMYKNTLVTLPGETDYNPAGQTIGGDTVTCTVNQATGQVTIEITGPGIAGGLGSNLYFVPGENYLSNDVDLKYAFTVKDNASNQEKVFTNDPDFDKTGLTSGVDYAQNSTKTTIDVDAVAQKGTFGADTGSHGEGDDGVKNHTHIEPGKSAFIDVDIDFHGDFRDGTEGHVFYVEAKGGYPLKSITLNVTLDGKECPITLNTADLTPPAGLFAPASQSSSLNTGGKEVFYNAFNIEQLVETWLTTPAGQAWAAEQNKGQDPPKVFTPNDLSGDMMITVELGTPTNVPTDNGVDPYEGVTINVGACTAEDWNKVHTQKDTELLRSNNEAFNHHEVELNFSATGEFSVGATQHFYENYDDSDESTKAWGNAVPISIKTGDGNDELTTFTLGLTDASKHLGNLYFIEDPDAVKIFKDKVGEGASALDAIEELLSEGYVVIKVQDGGTLGLAQLENALENSLTGDITDGQVLFVPKEHSYSGQNPELTYTIGVTDKDSGDKSAVVSGGLTIVGDAVAQTPIDSSTPPDPDAPDVPPLGYGTPRDVNVNVTFEDKDSEHYILVEAKAGWTVSYTAKDGVYIAKDGVLYFFKGENPDTSDFASADATWACGPRGGAVNDVLDLDENGVERVYYKIPVTGDLPAFTTSTDGTVSAVFDGKITLIAPSDHIYRQDDDYTIKMWAGSSESRGNINDAQDSEHTYHNNHAYTPLGDVTGSLAERTEGIGPWIEQVKPLYEDNKPYQYLSEEQADKLFAATPITTVGGEFIVHGPDGAKYVDITVEMVGGEPSMSIDGAEPKGNGVYRVTLDANGDARITVTLNTDVYADKDEDLSFTKAEFIDSDGNTMNTLGKTEVLVDAVADRPDLISVTEGVYVNDVKTDAVAAHRYEELKGTAQEASEDSVAHFKVKVNFGSDVTDTSESHYILIEHHPAWELANYPYDYVDIRGKEYIRVEITGLTPNANGEYDIAMRYVGGGVSDDTSKNGVLDYTLKVGAMSQESGVTDKEFNLQNNTSVNLDGSVLLQYSPLNSSGAMSVRGDHGNDTYDYILESGGSAILKLTGIAIDKSDVLKDLTINAITGGVGEFELVGKDGSSLTPALTWNANAAYNGFTADQLAKLASGDYVIKFTNNDGIHSNDDIGLSWSGRVEDTVSHASKSINGSKVLLVDAVADGSTFDGTAATLRFAYGDNNETAAKLGQLAGVIIDAKFTDLVNASEEHWVVLEQNDLRYNVKEVWVMKAGGTEWEQLDLANVVTKFGADGTPYFALKVPHGENMQVKFMVSTPDDLLSDYSKTLKGGTISVETTRDNTGGDREPDYSNNWTENIKAVTIHTGVVTATGVTGKAGANGAALTEYDPDLNAEAPSVYLNLGITGGANESITKLTITLPTAAQGTLTYNGAAVTGELTFAPGQFDPTKLVFTPKEYWSGTYTPNFTATVTDNASGAYKEGYKGSVTVTVNAVGTTPTIPDLVDPDPVTNNGLVSLTVAANFKDVDGSENHYLLVQALDGWQIQTPLPAGYTLLADTQTVGGVKCFAIQVADSTNPNPSLVVQLKPNLPIGTHTGEDSITLKVGGVAVEKTVTTDTSHCAFKEVEVEVTNTGAFSLSANTDPVESGDDMSFTLALRSGTAPITAAQDLTVTFAVSGIPDALADLIVAGGGTYTDASDMIWKAVGGGGYTVSVELPAGADQVDFSIPVTHVGADNGIIDADQSAQISLSLNDIPTVTGLADTVAGVGNYTFTIVDTEAAAVQTHGLDPSDFTGMGLVVMADGNHTSATAEQGQLIIGSDGDNEITGSAYDDTIRGGAGSDTMSGGEGKDTFLWLAEDFGKGSGDIAADKILDFQFTKGMAAVSDVICFDDVFKPEGGSLNDLLGNPSSFVDNTLTINDGKGTALEAKFVDDEHLMLTLKTGGDVVQTIEVTAAEGSSFMGGATDLDAGTAQEILQQIIKDSI